MSGLTAGGLLFGIFCILWTSLTGLVSGLVVYIYYKNRSRLVADFITLIASVVTIAMLASVSQQIYTLANWDALKQLEHEDSKLVAQGVIFFDVGSDKVVKAFYYIQIICYNLGGTLNVFWSFWLWANIWPLKGHWWRSKTNLNVAKAACISLCIVLFGVSQADILADRPMERFVVSNIMLILVLGLTPVFFCMILYRFVMTRIQASGGGIKEIKKFPKEDSPDNSTTGMSTQDSNVKSSTYRPSRPDNRIKTLSTMLMVRFVGAIVIISGLGAFHVCFQVFRINRFAGGEVMKVKEIPVTTGAQINDTFFFLPATAQGWLVLLVFGTTEDYWGRFVNAMGRVLCCCGIFFRSSKEPQDVEMSRASTRELVERSDWVALKSKNSDNGMPSPAPAGTHTRISSFGGYRSANSQRKQDDGGILVQQHFRSASYPVNSTPPEVPPKVPPKTAPIQPRNSVRDTMRYTAASRSNSQQSLSQNASTPNIPGMQTATYSWSVETVDRMSDRGR